MHLIKKLTSFKVTFGFRWHALKLAEKSNALVNKNMKDFQILADQATRFLSANLMPVHNVELHHLFPV